MRSARCCARRMRWPRPRPPRTPAWSRSTRRVGGGWQAPCPTAGRDGGGGQGSRAFLRRTPQAPDNARVAAFPFRSHEDRAMSANDTADAKPAWTPHQPADRILSTLKTRGALGIPDIAKVLRRHGGGGAPADGQAAGRGPGRRREPAAPGAAGRRRSGGSRPSGHARFPDTHAEMTVQMISAVIQVFGEKGMDQLIGAREETMRSQLPRGPARRARHQGATRAAGRGAQPRGLHGRVPRRRRGRGLSLHREPLPDLHRGARLHGLLPQRAAALRRGARARRER